MKKILYVSNIEVPYRVRFFNEFAKHCDLTVLYTRKKSLSRNDEWAQSEAKNYKIDYLKGINIGAEDSFSLGILKYVFSQKYDSVILGCYNSPAQMLAILLMRLFRKPYILNIDGEIFINGSGLKNKIKKFFLKGAKKYLVAGEKAADSLRSVVGDKLIIPYYFSSLSDSELQQNAKSENTPDGTVLVVSQFLDVKGLDVVAMAAQKDDSISYKLVGMGSKTQEFVEKYNINNIKNIEVIPFLQKEELEKEYKKCSLFVLASRQECWGLVINEAASFGVPIVSTFGSGAAVEFLYDDYSHYLAIAGDANDLYVKIKAALNDKNLKEYSDYLKRKSALYSIEHNVRAHIKACGI